MDNFKFLQKYYLLQRSIMFDKLIDLGFALLGYSANEPHFFWNNALINKELRERELDKIEKTLKNLDRKPALYFENSKKLLPLTVFLENHDYTKSAENSWMFWNEGRIDTQHFDSIKKVETISDLGIFLKVFNKCYQKDDPQNPYGELGEYLKVAKKVWKRHNNTNRLEYFLVYKGLEPVAVSTLTNYGGIGYISNVGSLRSVRGEGFGKAATLYCVQHSIKRKNKECCLATEEGEYPNSFYKRIGFPTRFTATVYTKQ